jgi:CDP-diacylglycerol--serine O-phosphatidyltransferase
MPSPAAAGVIAATVYAWPYPLVGYTQAIAALSIVLVPAALMVSTVKFRSFKSINFGWSRSYMGVFLVAALLALIATEPRVTLVLLAYCYLFSAFIEMGLARMRAHREPKPAAE